MYESQTHIKKWRDYDKRFGIMFERDEIYLQVFKKHLKKTYRGKPTKKYAKLKDKLDRMN